MHILEMLNIVLSLLSPLSLKSEMEDHIHIYMYISTCRCTYIYIQLFQFTLLDQSFKGTGQDRKVVCMGRLELILGFQGCRCEMDMEAENTISIANISFIQMARHRRSSLYGRGIVNFADNYSLRSHIPLRSCLVGLRL